MATKTSEGRTSRRSENYQNINTPIVVPKLNVIFEDFAIAFGVAIGGLGMTSIFQWVSNFMAVFTMSLCFMLATLLLLFARSRRKAEIEQRGVCRSGVLRRYFEYYFGADQLRGR